MTCGGEVQLFFEPHNTNRWKVVVFGAGHVAQALIPLLVKIGAAVTCVDPRAEWLEKIDAAFRVKKVCTEEMAGVVSELAENSFVVIMTKGHSFDLPILRQVLRQGPWPYVGVIGSKNKARTLRKALQADDFNSEQIDSIFCPIGLPIGTSVPVEIAISVVAQLLQVRDQS